MIEGEVLNEAPAKEIERNIRRREEAGSAAGELAVPREPKDVPIPPGSDSGERRAMKAATVEASSGRSQAESSRAVADGSRMDVEGEERHESRSSTEPHIGRRIVTKTSGEESRMDDGGEEEDESRSSTAPTTRRRIVTKTPLEENEGDERTVAVTTQESLDVTREKAMRTASCDEMGASSSARRGVNPGGPEIDKTKKAKEMVRALVGSTTKALERRAFKESNAKLGFCVCV